MLSIDPMHCLFLGVAKHFLKNVWIKNDIISPAQFDIIQSKVDKITVPSGIGRIPLKIQSGCSSFTADQFKNWVLYYSLLSLHGNLISSDLECWRHFVLACTILCSKRITIANLQLADALLLQFCRRSERQYGENIVTPNMHMMCHLKDCILDYGPIHEFWLFPYERYNGLLGEFPNNNKSIEVQVMKRFMTDQSLVTIPPPEDFQEDFQECLSFSSHLVGSVSDSLCSSLIWNPQAAKDSFEWTIDVIEKTISLPKYYTRGIFDTVELKFLTELYSRLYSVPSSDISMNSTFRKYGSVHICGKILGGYTTRSHTSSIVMISWDAKYFGTSPGLPNSASEDRPARINYFAKHSVTVQSNLKTHLLVSASWFAHHPRKGACAKPITVWEPDVFVPSGVHSVIRVQFICRRTVSLLDKLQPELPTVLLVIPCANF